VEIHTDFIVSLPFTRTGLAIGLAVFLIAALVGFALITKRRQRR